MARNSCKDNPRKKDYKIKMSVKDCKTFICENLFWFFYIPYSTWNFLSGVFTATAVNIFTSQIPESILSIGVKYIFAALLFLVIAIIMFYLSLFLKPLQERMDDYSSETRKREGPKKCWHNVIINQKVSRKLIGILIIMLLCIAGILLCLLL